MQCEASLQLICQERLLTPWAMPHTILFLQLSQSGLKNSLCGGHLTEALGEGMVLSLGITSSLFVITVCSTDFVQGTDWGRGSERCSPCLPEAYNQVGETGVIITSKLNT